MGQLWTLRHALLHPDRMLDLVQIRRLQDVVGCSGLFCSGLGAGKRPFKVFRASGPAQRSSPAKSFRYGIQAKHNLTEFFNTRFTYSFNSGNPSAEIQALNLLKESLGLFRGGVGIEDRAHFGLYP